MNKTQEQNGVRQNNWNYEKKILLIKIIKEITDISKFCILFKEWTLGLTILRFSSELLCYLTSLNLTY